MPPSACGPPARSAHLARVVGGVQQAKIPGAEERRVVRARVALQPAAQCGVPLSGLPAGPRTRAPPLPGGPAGSVRARSEGRRPRHGPAKHAAGGGVADDEDGHDHEGHQPVAEERRHGAPQSLRPARRPGATGTQARFPQGRPSAAASPTPRLRGRALRADLGSASGRPTPALPVLALVRRDLPRSTTRRGARCRRLGHPAPPVRFLVLVRPRLDLVHGVPLRRRRRRRVSARAPSARCNGARAPPRVSSAAAHAARSAPPWCIALVLALAPSMAPPLRSPARLRPPRDWAPCTPGYQRLRSLAMRRGGPSCVRWPFASWGG